MPSHVMGFLLRKPQPILILLFLFMTFHDLVKIMADELSGVTLIKNFCLDCHDGETQKGEINLKAALGSEPLVKNLDLWKTVINRIENGDMPPKKNDQPSYSEKKTLLKWLDREVCLLYTSPSPRDRTRSRMPSSA